MNNFFTFTYHVLYYFFRLILNFLIRGGGADRAGGGANRAGGGANRVGGGADRVDGGADRVGGGGVGGGNGVGGGVILLLSFFRENPYI